MTGTTDPADGTSGDPEAIYESLRSEIDRVLIGNDEAVEYLTIALLTRGHLLLEGVPGIAKTTLANLFARTTGLDYNRIQMTPDTPSRPTSRERTSTGKARGRSNSSAVPSSRTSRSPTRSTARRRRPRARCSRRWKSVA